MAGGGGVHGIEHVWQGGICVWGGRMHGRVVCVTGETATAVDAARPTGMHSCL